MDSEGGVGQRSGSGRLAVSPPLPVLPVLPEELLEVDPVLPDEPEDWLVLPGKPSLPDEVLLDDPELPDDPVDGDELGGCGSDGDEGVDWLVMAQPDSATATSSADASRNCAGH